MTIRLRRPNPFWIGAALASLLLIGAEARSDEARPEPTIQETRLLNESLALHAESQVLIQTYGVDVAERAPDRLHVIGERLRRKE